MSVAYVDWYGKARTQNWRTPRHLFDKWDALYHFTLDGASEVGNGLLPRASTAIAPLSWTRERVFCNPPWSNIAPFIEQALDADLAVFLLPARTNARWFHRALELGADPKFFLGRPKFEGAKSTCPVDCLLLEFRNPPLCNGCGDAFDGYDCAIHPPTPVAPASSTTSKEGT